LDEDAVRVGGRDRKVVIQAAHSASALSDEGLYDGVIPAAGSNLPRPVVTGVEGKAGCDGVAGCGKFAEVLFVQIPAL